MSFMKYTIKKISTVVIFSNDDTCLNYVLDGKDYECPESH